MLNHAYEDAPRRHPGGGASCPVLPQAPLSFGLESPAGGSPVRVQLMYFNAGGGHRASSLALEAAIGRAGLGWQVERVNLLERVDVHDVFRRWTGMAPEGIYNKRLAMGWTAGLAQELRLLQAGIRMGHPFLMKRLRQHWLLSRPDLVVSLVPNFNRAMFLSLQQALPGTPYATVMTDLADLPPRFWIEKGLPIHIVCGTPRAVAQAHAAGCAPSHVHSVSGMLLRHDFYAPRLGGSDRLVRRRELGLPLDRPVGLVLFGGEGSRQMLTIARQLPDVPLILLCGNNEALARALRELPARAPRAIVGYTGDIPQYMQLADFFIGKPGPGSLSEAIQMGLPCIVASNASTLPQERYNTHWLREQELGLTIGGYDEIAWAVARLLADLPRFQAAARRVRNHASDELPGVLAGIVAQVPTRAAAVLAAGAVMRMS